MKTLIWIILSGVGGAIGWWLGARFGFMTGYILSGIGSLAGVYIGVKLGREYL